MSEVDMASLKKLSRGTSLVFLGMILVDGLGYLTRIIIGRWLGPSSYGLISMGIAVLSIGTTIALLGMGTAITRYISFFIGKKNEEKIKGTIIASLRISIPLSVFFGAFIFIFSHDISIAVFHNEEFIPVLQIFSIALPFNVLMSVFLSSIRGFQNVKYKFYANDVFFSASKIVLVVAAIVLGSGTLGASIGWTFAIIATSILAGYYLERRIFPLIGSRLKSENVTRDLLMFSLPLMMGSAIKMFLSWSDILILGVMRTSLDVGVYDAALPTSNVIRSVILAFSFLFMPFMAEMQSKKETNKMGYIFKNTTRWVYIFTLPMFLLMFIFPGTILNILFGPEYLSGAFTLSILAVGAFVMSAFGPVVDLTIAIGKTKVYLLISAFMSILNVFLNVMLIPFYGITGAAFAMSLSLILGGLFFLVFIYSHLGFHPYSRHMIKPTMAGLISGGIIYMSKSFMESIDMYWAVLFGLMFVVIYAVLLMLMRSFIREDLEMLRSVERRSGLRMTLIRRIVKRFV